MANNRAYMVRALFFVAIFCSAVIGGTVCTVINRQTQRDKLKEFTTQAAQKWAEKHNKEFDTCIDHEVGVGKYTEMKLFCHVKNKEDSQTLMLHYDIGSSLPYEIVLEQN